MKRKQSHFRDLVNDFRMLSLSRSCVREAFEDGDLDGKGLFWRLSIIRWRQWRRLSFRACAEVAQ